MMIRFSGDESSGDFHDSPKQMSEQLARSQQQNIGNNKIKRKFFQLDDDEDDDDDDDDTSVDNQDRGPLSPEQIKIENKQRDHQYQSQDGHHSQQHEEPQQYQQQQQHQQHLQQQQQQHQQQQQQQQTLEYHQIENTQRPKRNPFCSRCRNHGVKAQVKGHKRHCAYRYCQCEGCELVEARQAVSALQIKRRRYQKQDEECGRKIEVSPPVLMRKSDSNPASLIAKTIIGSTKHIQNSSLKQLALGEQIHRQLNKNQMPIIDPAAAAATLAAAVASGSTPSSSSSLGASRSRSSPQHLGASCSPVEIASVANHHHHHHLFKSGNNQANHLPGGHLMLNHQNTNARAAAAAAAAALGVQGCTSPNSLNNAFHLFRFPAAMLSAIGPQGPQTNNLPIGTGVMPITGAPSHALFGAGPAKCSSLRTNSNSLANFMVDSHSMPNYREQMSLIEELDEDFGLLAIYAWLKAENFDIKKIRDTIELSRGPYAALLQANGHSALDLTSPIVD